MPADNTTGIADWTWAYKQRLPQRDLTLDADLPINQGFEPTPEYTVIYPGGLVNKNKYATTELYLKKTQKANV